jgi:hypothetical protein
MQCLACGWDWHDDDHHVQRGSPTWNRFGIEPERQYVVELCQRPDGHRYAQYRFANIESTDTDAVLETVPALGQRFIEYGFHVYCKELKLTSGESFAFDSHGIWLTETEIRRMKDRSTPYWEGDQSFWVNGIAPQFPPG